MRSGIQGKDVALMAAFVSVKYQYMFPHTYLLWPVIHVHAITYAPVITDWVIFFMFVMENYTSVFLPQDTFLLAFTP